MVFSPSNLKSRYKQGWYLSTCSGSDSKASARNAGDPGLIHWVGKIPWRRKSTPALLPGKSNGRRSLIGYSPWGRKESETTEWLRFHFLSLLYYINLYSWHLFKSDGYLLSLASACANLIIKYLNIISEYLLDFFNNWTWTSMIPSPLRPVSIPWNSYESSQYPSQW